LATGLNPESHLLTHLNPWRYSPFAQIVQFVAVPMQFVQFDAQVLQNKTKRYVPGGH